MVIFYPTQVDLVFQTISSHKMVAMVVARVKEKTLRQLASNIHVSSFCHKAFWVPTPTKKRFYSLMC